MKNNHLPRNRKVTVNDPLEKPPKKFEFLPIIQRKSVISGFVIREPTADIIRERAKIIKKIRQEYPQITSWQLDSAAFKYGDYHVEIELKQFSEVP